MHGIHNLRSRVWLKTLEFYRQIRTNLGLKNVTEQYNYAKGNWLKILELRYWDPSGWQKELSRMKKRDIMKNKYKGRSKKIQPTVPKRNKER
jgi:hypothetical protein